jgi:hypothetical protein
VVKVVQRSIHRNFTAMLREIGVMRGRFVICI